MTERPPELVPEPRSLALRVEHPAVGVTRVVAPCVGIVGLAVLGLVPGPVAIGALAAIGGVHGLAWLLGRFHGSDE